MAIIKLPRIGRKSSKEAKGKQKHQTTKGRLTGADFRHDKYRTVKKQGGRHYEYCYLVIEQGLWEHHPDGYVFQEIPSWSAALRWYVPPTGEAQHLKDIPFLDGKDESRRAEYLGRMKGIEARNTRETTQFLEETDGKLEFQVEHCFESQTLTHFMTYIVKHGTEALTKISNPADGSDLRNKDFLEFFPKGEYFIESDVHQILLRNDWADPKYYGWKSPAGNTGPSTTPWESFKMSWSIDMTRAGWQDVILVSDLDRCNVVHELVNFETTLNNLKGQLFNLPLTLWEGDEAGNLYSAYVRLAKLEVIIAYLRRNARAYHAAGQRFWASCVKLQYALEDACKPEKLGKHKEDSKVLQYMSKLQWPLQYKRFQTAYITQVEGKIRDGRDRTVTYIKAVLSPSPERALTPAEKKDVRSLSKDQRAGLLRTCDATVKDLSPLRWDFGDSTAIGYLEEDIRDDFDWANNRHGQRAQGPQRNMEPDFQELRKSLKQVENELDQTIDVGKRGVLSGQIETLRKQLETHSAAKYADDTDNVMAGFIKNDRIKLSVTRSNRRLGKMEID